MPIDNRFPYPAQDTAHASTHASSGTDPVTPEAIGAVPTTRKVNNKALSADISLTPADVGARPDTWVPTAADVGAIAAATLGAANGVATLAADGMLTEGQVRPGVGRAGSATGAEVFNDYANNRASGPDSHAEGANTTASGQRSHAEGLSTTASGDYSHAEGWGATASGLNSHAEGWGTTASGPDSHAEGQGTRAEVLRSHAEGMSTIARGTAAHAEGSSTIASGLYSHAEGKQTTASGSHSHAEGAYNKANGEEGHAEGKLTTANGDSSHAEGVGTTAEGYGAHAEGFRDTEGKSIAYGKGSHVEGIDTVAGTLETGATTPFAAHAEGANTTASGQFSHAEGYGAVANGKYSHAEGHNTIADTFQHVSGRYNLTSNGPIDSAGTEGNLFIVGNGTSGSARSNAFRLTTAGYGYFAKGSAGTGADIAELFEWLDGNPDNEDRRGRFVTIRDGKITYPTSPEDYIVGIISSAPNVISDNYADEWSGKYLRDVFGSILTEKRTQEAYTDEDGTYHEAVEYTAQVLNPDWDPDKPYVPREDRPEWSPVGVHGKLVTIDDGTCQVNGYCKPSGDGIATHSDEPTPYYVMTRLDSTHVRVFVK